MRRGGLTWRLRRCPMACQPCSGGIIWPGLGDLAEAAEATRWLGAKSGGVAARAVVPAASKGWDCRCRGDNIAIRRSKRFYVFSNSRKAASGMHRYRESYILRYLTNFRTNGRENNIIFRLRLDLRPQLLLSGAAILSAFSPKIIGLRYR